VRAVARAHTEDIFTDEINPANTKRPLQLAPLDFKKRQIDGPELYQI
jgi:hypothetical protein